MQDSAAPQSSQCPCPCGALLQLLVGAGVGVADVLAWLSSSSVRSTLRCWSDWPTFLSADGRHGGAINPIPHHAMHSKHTRAAAAAATRGMWLCLLTW